MNVLEQLDTYAQWSIEKRGYNIYAQAEGDTVYVCLTTRRAVARLLSDLARNSTQCSASRCKYTPDRENKSETAGGSGSPKP
jgi:hypothetical protein